MARLLLDAHFRSITELQAAVDEEKSLAIQVADLALDAGPLEGTGITIDSKVVRGGGSGGGAGRGRRAAGADSGAGSGGARGGGGGSGRGGNNRNAGRGGGRGGAQAAAANTESKHNKASDKQQKPASMWPHTACGCVWVC